MATIKNRGPYQYRAQIRRKGYPPISKTFKFLAEANIWARSVESLMDQGKYKADTQANKITIAELAKTYLEDETPAKKNLIEEKRLMNVIIKEFGGYHLSNLRSSMVRTWINNMKKAGLAGSTINHHLSTLSILIETASKEWGYELTDNPCRLVKRQPAGKARDRRLLEGEEARILKQCDLSRNIYLSKIFTLSIETAMRQGEIFSLVWEDIDLDKQLAIARDTKNEEDRRIPLSTKAVATFKLLPKSSEGKVIKCSQHGVASSFRQAVERARIEYLDECTKNDIKPRKDFLLNLRMHDLRHEGTSRLFEKGLNIMEVASITGHKTLQMLKRYTHLDNTNLLSRLG